MSAEDTLTLEELDQLRELLERFQRRFLTRVDASSISLPDLIELVDDISESPGVPN